MNLAEVLDWTSIKLTGGSFLFAAITGDSILMALSGVAIGTTIIYNAIRIYKELKRKK